MHYNGFYLKTTCGGDRLTPDDPGRRYLHKQKTDIINDTKVERFFEPVAEVKDEAPYGNNGG